MFWFLTISDKLLILFAQICKKNRKSLTYCTFGVPPSWLTPSLTLSRHPVTSLRNTTVHTTILPAIESKQSDRTLWKTKKKKGWQEQQYREFDTIYSKPGFHREIKSWGCFDNIAKYIINFLTWRMVKVKNKTRNTRYSSKRWDRLNTTK